MISWFRRNSFQSQTTHQLSTKIDELEATVQKLVQKPSEVHIHIHQLDIHQPVLEQLTFRLDQLDIDELSGSLNIGNNLGIQTPRQQVSKTSSKRKDEVSSTMSQSGIKMNSNPTGYSVRYNPSTKGES